MNTPSSRIYNPQPGVFQVVLSPTPTISGSLTPPDAAYQTFFGMEQISLATSHHEAPSSDAGNSDEAMPDCGSDIGSSEDDSESSEDQLSAPVAARSSMAPKNPHETPGSSRSNNGQRGPISTLVRLFSGRGGDGKDTDHEGKERGTVDNNADEVRRLNSLLKVQAKKIKKLKKRVQKLDKQCIEEQDSRMSLGKELDDMEEDAEWRSRELDTVSLQLKHVTRDFQDKSKELDKMKGQWNDMRIKNVELTKALNEQHEKLATLRQAIARAGRRDEQPVDDEIAQRFSSLRNDIMQFVGVRFSSAEGVDTSDDEEDGADEELEELQIRHFVARELHQRFFASGSDFLVGVFGAPVTDGGDCEQQLRDGGCTESLIKARRIAHIKACTATSHFGKFLDDFAERECAAFWNQVEHDQRWISRVAPSEDTAAKKAIVALFQSAARLAIYLQGLRIEYEWEQNNRPYDIEVNKKEDEIIGTYGPDPAEVSEYELGFVVFGGVVRGDKTSGLLADAKVRLLKNHIVIRERTL